MKKTLHLGMVLTAGYLAILIVTPAVAQDLTTTARQVLTAVSDAQTAIVAAVNGLTAAGIAAGTPQSDTALASPGGCTRRDTMSAGVGVADGDIGIAGCDQYGAQQVVITSGGAVATLASDGTEDVAEASGVTGPVVLGVRRDVAAASSGTTGDYSTFNTDALGLLWARFQDPCSGVAKVVVPVDIVTATTTQLIAASASNKAYICGVFLGPVGGADNVAMVEDDTSACASPTAGMFGGTTAAEGWNMAANGGTNIGNGLGTVGVTAATNRYVCLITSAAVQLPGTVVYALAP